jgi:hypothetical protein
MTNLSLQHYGMCRAVALAADSELLQQLLPVGLFVTGATFLGGTVCGVTLRTGDVDVL